MSTHPPVTLDHPVDAARGTRQRRAGAIAMEVVLAVLLVAGILGTGSDASAAPAAAVAPASQVSDAEGGFFTLLNRARGGAGLPALQADPKLADTSRTWSGTMSEQNRLYHDPNLVTIVASVEPRWQGGAENVGVGYSVQSLHDAFMNSPGHRANMMSSRYNRVGIGVVFNGTKMWVTVRFVQGPALTATSIPAPQPAALPTPPGVRTVLTGDFNADGFGDMLTYGPGAEADELWFGMAGRTLRKVPVSIKGQYQPVAGDFDGDRRTDILWYAPGAASDAIWEWSSSGWVSSPRTINGFYTARAGDFDGDRVDDIFWYAPGTASDYRWYGNTNGTFSSLQTTVSDSFIPVIGDFDGNGGDDVFWYGRGSARDVVWYSTRQRGAQRSASTTVGGSHTPFAGDLDGNGSDDIVLYTPGTAGDAIWYNSSAAFGYRRTAEAVNGTYVPATSDFDANGKDDIVWYSPAGGATSDPLWWGVSTSVNALGRTPGTVVAG